MKAIDAVANLRKLADLLEKHGDVDIRMSSATVWFDGKDAFCEVAQDFPKPYQSKAIGGLLGQFNIEAGHITTDGQITITVPHELIGTLARPSKPAQYVYPDILAVNVESEDQ